MLTGEQEAELRQTLALVIIYAPSADNLRAVDVRNLIERCVNVVNNCLESTERDENAVESD